MPGIPALNAAILSMLFLFLTGCAMSDLPMSAPKASGSIPIAHRTSVEALFACAERSVQELARADDRWDPRVTRRDPASGVLETGNYPEENESGFRVKLSLDREGDRALIEIKGAGAYFVDLGVESAMVEFKSKLSGCIGS
jgi:hypothetical protein